MLIDHYNDVWLTISVSVVLTACQRSSTSLLNWLESNVTELSSCRTSPSTACCSAGDVTPCCSVGDVTPCCSACDVTLWCSAGGVTPRCSSGDVTSSCSRLSCRARMSLAVSRNLWQHCRAVWWDEWVRSRTLTRVTWCRTSSSGWPRWMGRNAGVSPLLSTTESSLSSLPRFSRSSELTWTINARLLLHMRRNNGNKIITKIIVRTWTVGEIQYLALTAVVSCCCALYLACFFVFF